MVLPAVGSCADLRGESHIGMLQYASRVHMTGNIKPVESGR